MELIRISDQKLKIMLTPFDMNQFELNMDGFEENSEMMHRSFRRLLAEIHRQIDFDADDSHMSVQYFPSREGGCEMFICNLPTEEAKRETASNELSLPERSTVSPLPVKRSGGSFKKDTAYRFERLQYLLAVCRRLDDIGFTCESAVWQDEKSSYFLFLTFPSGSPYSTPDELDFIVEYGTLENISQLRLYIREHGKVICRENAIRALSGLG